MPGTDPDLVKPLQRRIEKRYEAIHLETKVAKVNVADDALVAHFEGRHEAVENFDRVLVAVGRTPNGAGIGAEHAGVNVDERGFIPVDRQMRTNVPHIFAIGDVVGQPMLAHKATHEARVAAEVCAGEKSAFDARVIPSVAYTDPEVAWVGVTEAEAKAGGLDYSVGKFPWVASGRALGIDRSEGFTKLLFDTATKRIIGAGITGPQAGDLIAECALAIEMGAVSQDLALTIHAHPTLPEGVMEAAKAVHGEAIHVINKKPR
jgi:dihydrolipoamide dehydrogenase